MNGHLVTVEVGVERCTCKRVKLYGLTLDHTRLEGLNTESVKCRSTVEKNRMTFHHVLKNLPDDRILAVHDFLGTLDSLHNAALDELAYDEWFVELCCHILWKTALMHLELRTHNDNRTC